MRDPSSDAARVEQLSDARYRVDGRELALPMEIADFSLLAQVFAVKTAAVRELLDGTRLRPAELWPGTSALALMAVQYRDNPLGDYNEAIVSVPAYTPQTRAVPGFGGLDLVLRRASHFVHAMPVDQDFTRVAGRALWGYPKVLATIDVAFEAGRARGELRDEASGSTVFAIEAPARDRGRFRQRAATLTHLEGMLRKIETDFEVEGVGFRLGGAPPVIGEHDTLALTLRKLGLPKKPLLSASLRSVRATFGKAQVL